MKILTLIAVSGLMAVAPALSQVSPATEGVAQADVLAPNAQTALDTAITVQTPTATDPLATAPAAPAAPSVPTAVTGTWAGLEDNTRYLMIMGTADGFSATGEGAPCFPGRDNSKLDDELTSKGFGSKDPTALGDALVAISAPKAECKTPARGYTTDLLKGMPDDHLASYITGVVRGYASIKPCPAANHAFAGASAAAALLAETEPKAPHLVLGPALDEACAPTEEPVAN